MPVVTDHDNKNPSWAQEHQPWSSEHHSRAQPGVQSKAKLPTPPPTLPDTRKEFPTLDIAQVEYIVYMDDPFLRSFKKGLFHAKMTMPDLLRYPFKAMANQVCIR